MGSINIMQIATVVGGLALSAASAYALIRFNPTPFRNLFYAAFALGMFAVGTGSKLDVNLNSTDGLKLQVAQLAKTIDAQRQEIDAQKQQIASLSVSSPNWQVLSTKIEGLQQKALRYDDFLSGFSQAVKVKPTASDPDAVTFDRKKFQVLLDNLQRTAPE